MPNKLKSDTLPIIHNQLYLTKRHNSRFWQCRYKIDNHWFRTSTNKEDLAEAKEAALEKMLETKLRQKLGIPTVTRKFRNVAQLAARQMQDDLEAGRGKVIYKHYLAVIEQYLIPHFGNQNIDKINYSNLLEYEQWRREKMQREPAASTINTHNAALNRIFDEAVNRGFLQRSKLPTLRNKGNKTEQRPAFTIPEYTKLYRYMRGWVRKGRNGKPRMMRQLLREYVLILANTGMRHGTESYSLRWSDLTLTTLNDKQYLQLQVQGKVGRRALIARSNAIPFFKRLHQQQDDIKDIPFEKLIEQRVNKKVFRLGDGTETTALNKTFERLLREVGLLSCPETEQNRTLYSLRHSYATWRIIHTRIPIHVLADQMGTSVQMIEKHYKHSKIWDFREHLAG